MLAPIAALTLSLAASAQVPSWSPEFAAAGLGGRVLSLTDFGGDLIAGGEWSATKGGILHGLARWDGTTWRPASAGVDLIGRMRPANEPEVLALASWNGALYFAGMFDRAGGQPIDSIARWDGTTVQPLGAGIRLSFDNAAVWSLAVYANELYATGLFDTAGGQPVNSVARWDGSVWRAVGGGLFNVTNQTIGTGRCLHVHGGVLYVGGEFETAGGVPARNIAAWNGATWSAVGPGAPFPVRALESYGTSLVAAAQFTIAGAQHMLARWTGTAWAGLGTGGPDLPVTCLRAIGTALYAGGHFYNVGPQLARFDGQTWGSIGGVHGVFSGITTPFLWALHRRGTELIVGGEFTTVGANPGAVGAIGSVGVAAFDGSGWRGLGTGLGVDAPVRRVLPWRGSWIAAGQFGEAGTVRAVGIARYDGDRWNTFGAFDGEVADAVEYQGGLIVVGAFTRIDGQAFPGIARHDGTQWRSFATQGATGLCVHSGQLFARGGATLRRWNTTGWLDVAPVTGIVSGLLSHNGALYVTADSAFTHTVYAWNGTQLTTVGSPNDFIHTIAAFGNDVLIGGRFTAVSGVAANLMARWTGAGWASLPAAVSGYSVDAFGELDGVLHAGVSGEPRGSCLALRNNVWQPVGVPPQGLPQMFFTDRATASLYCSGSFFTAGGLPSRNLAEWRTQPAWRNRLHGHGGAAGVPQLLGRGALTVSSPVQWTVEAPANAVILWVLGATRVDQPLLGGVLVPYPNVVSVLVADVQGRASLGFALPGIAAGTSFFTQGWVLDPSAPQGLSATNALECTVQ